jgi:predicted dehydrogenase
MLSIGIAGAGFIGRVHARASLLAGGRLVGAADRSPEESRAAALRLGAEIAFDTAEEMIDDPGIDLIHICTPNHVHALLAERALRNGKHVICEKPLGMNPQEAARVTDAAAASGKVAAVPFVYRFHPMARQARAMIRAGEVGRIHLIHGSYLQDWLSRVDDFNWRVDSSTGGASRAFADIGSHWCDLVEFVSGQRIKRVWALTYQAFAERRYTPDATTFAEAAAEGIRTAVETEDAGVVLFETFEGSVGSAVISQVSPGRKNRLWFEIDGTLSSVVFDQENPEHLWVGRRERIELLARDPMHLAADVAPYAFLPAGHSQGYQDCFNAFVADVYQNALGGQTSGLPVFADGLRAVRITDAVMQSAHTGDWAQVAG